ncbi:hypothetical protein NBRC116583_02530 [Arenicella sp. 4NH20-0111]|uniref:hypothetical protein n=1 Tax=Arenicella sp. 4NH20-0111 TaxID=3127648 RepID=UPI003106E84C
MNNISRVLYLLIGLVIFVSCGWATMGALLEISNNPNHKILGIPTNIWIGTLGSISASGIFFTVSEALRWVFDHKISENYNRLKFYEEKVGITDFFNQKGSDQANSDYSSAIAKAKHRVWAFGISNGEFLSEHLELLITKKKRTPKLDICICFVDPETNIILNRGKEVEQISQVQLFDITRDSRTTTDTSSRVLDHIKDARTKISPEHVDIDIKLVTAAGYVSAMVVDDVIYVFPFTAVSKDNTRTPYLKVTVTSQIGKAFLSFLENVKDHPRLTVDIS